MTATYRASSTYEGTTGSVSLTLPVSGSGGTVVPGDVAVIFMWAGTTNVWVGPTGWTALKSTSSPPMSTSLQSNVYVKKLTSTDISNKTVPFTLPGFTSKLVLNCVVVSSADDNITAADVTAASTSSATRVAPSVTVPSGGLLIEGACDKSSTDHGPWTAPAGFTIREHTEQSGGGALVTSVATKSGTGGGETWTDTLSCTQGHTWSVAVPNLTNAAPTASAGSAQTVDPWSTVTLDGSGSTDSDGTVASYLWRQISGTTVTLSSTTAVKPTFAAPAAMSDATLVFGLKVTDNGGAQSSEATVTITVSSATEAMSDGSGHWVPMQHLNAW